MSWWICSSQQAISTFAFTFYWSQTQQTLCRDFFLPAVICRYNEFNGVDCQRTWVYKCVCLWWSWVIWYSDLVARLMFCPGGPCPGLGCIFIVSIIPVALARGGGAPLGIRTAERASTIIIIRKHLPHNISGVFDNIDTSLNFQSFVKCINAL